MNQILKNFTIPYPSAVQTGHLCPDFPHAKRGKNTVNSNYAKVFVLWAVPKTNNLIIQ
jgi:hypothetical protein